MLIHIAGSGNPTSPDDDTGPLLSKDGLKVFFAGRRSVSPTSAPIARSVYIWDAENRTNAMIAPAGDNSAEIYADTPAMDSDGKLFAFLRSWK